MAAVRGKAIPGELVWQPRQPAATVDRVKIYDAGGLAVWAEVDDEGTLTISGQDLSGHPSGQEYEYHLTVSASEVPIVIEALGGQPGDHVLSLLRAHAEAIVKRGELAWLKSIGVQGRSDIDLALMAQGAVSSCPG